VRLSAAHRLANPRRARSSHPRPAGPLLRTSQGPRRHRTGSFPERTPRRTGRGPAAV